MLHWLAGVSRTQQSTCKNSRQVLIRNMNNTIIMYTHRDKGLLNLIRCRMDPAGCTQHLYTAGCQGPLSGSPGWPAADR